MGGQTGSGLAGRAVSHSPLARTVRGREGGTPGLALRSIIGGYAVRRMPYGASLEDLNTAMEIFTLCVKLSSIDKLLG